MSDRCVELVSASWVAEPDDVTFIGQVSLMHSATSSSFVLFSRSKIRFWSCIVVLLVPCVSLNFCVRARIDLSCYATAKARTSPNSCVNFVQESPLSSLKKSCPLTLQAISNPSTLGLEPKHQIVLFEVIPISERSH